ncbi:MAG TPA: hypothetical protein VNC11_11830 [Gemmatimonadaceae bacterium]|jgi:hypothetical protein|nr:hypothetical protein [Gemmatimonadaceae bacterium]
MTRKNRRSIVLGIVLTAGFASLAAAQGPIAQQQQQNAPRRAELEQRVRDRIAQVVRRRLQLSDDQMNKLATANRQFDQQRSALVMEERQARVALRTELQAGDNANQQKVSGYLDQLMRLQRRRLDLVESEQRELAKFLTPVQRARYFALQAEIRQRTQQLRDRGPGGRPGMMNPGARRNLR